MIVDIHTHILPYVDDGAENWDVSLELLQQAESQGVIAMVATPHILNENDYRLEENIITKYRELKKRARENNLKIKLYLGCEIYAQPDMTLDHKISTYNNNQKYFLVEFPMTSIPQFVAQKFFDLILEEKTPIIAHPERNAGFINKPSLAYEFVQRGALMQINALSLLGKHGSKPKDLAYKLISYNLAHFVASDSHDPEKRSVRMAECYEIVASQWGAEKAKMLFYENPAKAIKGISIDREEPIPLHEEQKQSFWKRMKLFN
ncbi:hypothetical protein GF337_01100 [candidate division KSB1 bacterium]|nr:hypothetical protein [candidate division KSB1 bacterium]